MENETRERLEAYLERLDKAENSWRDYGIGAEGHTIGEKPFSYTEYGIHCSRVIAEARDHLLEAFPELKEQEAERKLEENSDNFIKN